MEEKNHSAKRSREAPSNPGRFMLSFKSQQDGSEVYYRCRADRKIQYLLMEYCKEMNVDYQTAAFLYDGQRINVSFTPLQLGMENGDLIEVMFHVDGGGLHI